LRLRRSPSLGSRVVAGYSTSVKDVVILPPWKRNRFDVKALCVTYLSHPGSDTEAGITIPVSFPEHGELLGRPPPQGVGGNAFLRCWNPGPRNLLQGHWSLVPKPDCRLIHVSALQPLVINLSRLLFAARAVSTPTSRAYPRSLMKGPSGQRQLLLADSPVSRIDSDTGFSTRVILLQYPWSQGTRYVVSNGWAVGLGVLISS